MACLREPCPSAWMLSQSAFVQDPDYLWTPGGGLVARLCWTLCDPGDCSHLAPLSMGFSWQEYWRGLPFPSPGELPDPGIEPNSVWVISCIAGGFFTDWATRELAPWMATGRILTYPLPETGLFRRYLQGDTFYFLTFSASLFCKTLASSPCKMIIFRH